MSRRQAQLLAALLALLVAGVTAAKAIVSPDPNFAYFTFTTSVSIPTSTETVTVTAPASTVTTTVTTTVTAPQTTTTASTSTTSSSTTSTTPPPPSGPVFGFSTGSGPDTVTAFDSLTRGIYYDHVIAAGATSVRVDYYGAPVNDQVVTDARLKGLDVLVDPTRIGSYPADCTYAAKKYGPQGVHEFELGNESNINGVTPATYASKAKSCAAAIRAVEPDATVVIGGLSNYGVYPQADATHWNPVLYLEQVLAVAGTGWFDAVSFHPYGFCDNCTAERAQANPSGWYQIAGQSPSLVSTEARYGAPQVVWVTEDGAPTDEDSFTGGMSETEQGRLVTLAVGQFKTAPWAGRFFWYSLRDRPSQAGRECCFGLLHGDWTAKPGYAAFRLAVG